MRCRIDRRARSDPSRFVPGGFVYLNNRYHDSTLGVFLSMDPLVGVSGDPYLYASGNPTTLSDLLGLSPSDACSFGGGGGACARAAYDELRSMPKPTGPKRPDDYPFSDEMWDFDHDVALSLGSSMVSFERRGSTASMSCLRVNVSLIDR